jgi:hypothetical protein
MIRAKLIFPSIVNDNYPTLYLTTGNKYVDVVVECPNVTKQIENHVKDRVKSFEIWERDEKRPSKIQRSNHTAQVKKEIILNTSGTIEILKEIKSGRDQISYQLRYSDETIAIESDWIMRKTTYSSKSKGQCSVTTGTITNGSRISTTTPASSPSMVLSNEMTGVPTKTIGVTKVERPLDRLVFLKITKTGKVEEDAKEKKDNRIMRIFKDKYFALVSCEDRGMGGLKELIKNGIEYRGYRYHFLLFSQSSKNSRGPFYAVREDAADEVKSFVYDRMADFSEAKKTGFKKYVSRMSLSFGTSFLSIDVPDNEHAVLDDITTEKYNFTDGAGIITDSYALKIKEALKLEVVPGAIQCRYKGFKGVYAVYKEDSEFIQKLREKYPGVHLFSRKSMKKYEDKSGYDGLDVLNIAQDSGPALINRHMIMILNTLGVPSEVLKEAYGQRLEEIGSCLTSPGIAYRILYSGDGSTGIDERMKQILITCAECDEEAIQDPYIFSKLKSKVKSRLEKDLKESKIKYEISSSRYLMGVPDELGILNENEVCVVADQHLDENTNVIVTRNPCVQLGDIRLCKQKWIQEYSDKKGCIVFPTNCSRPLQDMMGGGDLDGDLYFVCWDPIYTKINVKEPMDYSAPSVPQVDTIPENIEELVSRLIDSYLSDKSRVGKLEFGLRSLYENGGMDTDEYKIKAKNYSLELDGKLYGNIDVRFDLVWFDKFRQRGTGNSNKPEDTVENKNLDQFINYYKSLQNRTIVTELLLMTADKLKWLEAQQLKLAKEFISNEEVEKLTSRQISKIIYDKECQSMPEVISNWRKEFLCGGDDKLSINQIFAKYIDDFLTRKFYFEKNDDEFNAINHEPFSLPLKMRALAYFRCYYDQAREKETDKRYALPWIVYDYLCALKCEAFSKKMVLVSKDVIPYIKLYGKKNL